MKLTNVLFASFFSACLSYGAGTVATESGMEMRVNGIYASVSQTGGESQTTFKETSEEAAERMSHQPSLANERISVRPPQGDVPLGNPIDIDVTFAPGMISNMHVAQVRLNGNVRKAIQQSEDAFKIVREEGQTRTLEIVPMQLGPINLRIVAAYADNAIAEQTVTLNVVPSAKGLKKFFIDGGATATFIVMGDEEKDRQLWLKPVVTYAQLKHQILLEDSRQIKLSIEQDENDPVLRVDPNGLVHALRVGTAVIVGDFCGAINRVEITVYGKDDAPAGYEPVTH